MVDRRTSLIDQLAMAAAFTEDLDFDSGDEEVSSGESQEDDMEDLGDQQVVGSSDGIIGAVSVGDVEEGLIMDEAQNSVMRAVQDGTEYYPSHGSMDVVHDHASPPVGFLPARSSSLNNAGIVVARSDLRPVPSDSVIQGSGLLQSSTLAPHPPSTHGSQSAPTSPVPSGVARRGSHSLARPSIKITVAGGASIISEGNEEDPPSGNKTASPRLQKSSMANSNRRHYMPSQSPRPTTVDGLDETLKSPGARALCSEWDDFAAAATVVTTGTQGAGNAATRHLKFAVGDTVLVLLTLLNVTNVEDPKDTFTVAPVNRLGFPQGVGRTDEEKVGPYIFVLATVKHVHFDEDDRYYTIVRADTGSEQRADSGWIEPLNDPVGIEAASRAAKLTVRSAQDKPAEALEETGYLHDARDFVVDIVSWPADIGRSKFLPWYEKQRANAKHTVMLLVYGESPFACRLRITGINFLVLCSLTFLFSEVVTLAFLPATYDQLCSIIVTVVWCILVLELIFELIVRPKGYADLIQSDRAFSPSTARHINRFHMVFESIALITYIPEFRCFGNEICERGSGFSRVTASLDFLLGESRGDSARGRFLLGLTALRLFGPIRHWKHMFINDNFRTAQSEGIERWPVSTAEDDDDAGRRGSGNKHVNKKNDDDGESFAGYGDEYLTKLTSAEEDQHLKNAATIGTALIIVNSQRALLLLTAIVLVLPMLHSLTTQNLNSYNMVDLLQAHNLEAPTNSTDDCAYLENAVDSWLKMVAMPQASSPLQNTEDTYVLWAQLLPVRCDFQRDDGVITFCEGHVFEASWGGAVPETCAVWDSYQPSWSTGTIPRNFSDQLAIRSQGIRRIDSDVPLGDLSIFRTDVIYNENPTVSLSHLGDFLVLLGILLVGLYGLNALRGEAIRLVLDPLQRMLKIVLRYAENPLSQDVNSASNGKDSDNALDLEEIGNYETEQLINAITKIADLLRKCWGVAGAGIISSNLARTKDGKTVVFNPTVPGKRVYALFGFVAINGFSEQLRALDRDVMILINDVAKVVHDEVYRWALGDHGQCNKNLGAAFLMVFRIGDFSEVQKKKQVATEKLFREHSKTSSKRAANLRKRNAPHSSNGRSPYSGRKGSKQDVDGQLQLASLPGIQAFTDRALLGMLKSFAGVHRDKQLTTVWKNDFRLSAGVSAYHVDIIYGMDAGWAVEGAVGSEYKIDATYLSPHVNMASRMMSASKQYGVTILLSKAVEELLSRTCRKKLRHLDTVYVKGSKVKQEIYTYDARFQGVDFFLFERTPDQADHDAESYTPNIWEHDRDLLAMRQHVSDAFAETFHLGVKQYIAGKWQEAYKTLERADDIMIETVLAEGYLEYDMEQLEGRILDRKYQSEDIVRIRHRIGDGACRALMAYMEKRSLRAPDDWDGVRSLASK